MRREVVPHSVSPLVQFPPSAFSSILGNKFSEEGTLENTVGYISQNGMWTWIVKGSTLEVFSTCTGERCSTWCFGSVVKNSSANITAVTEFCSSDHCGLHLVVALNWGNVGALLCVFDVKISKVVKAVEIPYKITSLEVISSHGSTGKEYPSLSNELGFMFGIVSVGTEGGHVIFLDLCLDEENYSNELSPSQACFITRHTHNIPGRREHAVAHNQHICLPLNDESCHYEYFEYRNNSNNCLSAFPSDDVVVSSLKYINKLATLAVGFSFGGFQLWNIQDFILEFSYNLELDLQGVARFAFQEPENDPKNFCYLWVVRGQCQGVTNRPNTMSTASLYSLTYSKKKWIDNYGFLYEELQSCSIRLEYYLSCDPLNPTIPRDPITSRLIACYTVPQSDVLRRPDQDDALQEEEWNNNHDLSICVLAWEAWQGASDIVSSSFLVLFDINQWYQSQMPSFVGNAGSELCPYLGVFSLSEIADRTSPEPVLDVCLISQSLTKFKCLTVADQFFYPSSLAFSVYCISERGVIQTSFFGTQRQILSEMISMGPACLIDPKDLYSCCVIAGLLSHASEVVSLKTVTQMHQREALLTVALQNNLADFLSSCIQHWSSGEFRHSDCTLKFLLDWAWKRITQIKTSMDKLFTPLFNCSGEVLSKNSLQLLHSYGSQLKQLSDLLVVFQYNSGPMSEQGKRELIQRAEVVHIINTYLQVVLWLYNCCLLPEHLEGDEYGENEVSYPSSYLSRGYNDRRMSFQKLHSSVGQTDILLIDGIVSKMGQSLSNLWEKSGGDGLYPPPSLYAALGAYFVEGSSLINKHCLILYLLLDMAAFLSDRQSHLAEKLVTFSATFNVNPSKVKLTQGFWLLDHQDFEEAIAVLLNPIISPTDIHQWQHIRVLKAFLYHGEHQKALKYSKVFHIPHSAEEVKLHLSILLGNQMIAEALHYQRQFSDQNDKEDLLTHLFLGCQQTHLLDSLLQQPLMPSEVKALIDFLNYSPEPQCRELLVMYHLLNGRPMDAVHVNDTIASCAMVDNQGRSASRNALIHGYLNVLPEEQKILAQEIKHDKHVFYNNDDKDKPIPLSAVVTSRNLQLVSYADLLQAVMSRISETHEGLQQNSEIPDTRFAWHMKSASPFLGLLLTPISKKERVSTEVVFPTPKRPSNHLYDYHQDLVSPSKRSKFMDISPVRLGDNERRRSQKHLSGEVLSLLHTPPVCRKPSAHGKDTYSEQSITPQSILKVRHFLRRSKSPVVLDAAHVTTSDFTHEEFMLEDNSEGEELDVVNPEGAQCTSVFKEDDGSKQLRFQVPKRSTDGERLSAPCTTTVDVKGVAEKAKPNLEKDISQRFMRETYHASPRRPLHDYSRSSKSMPVLSEELNSSGPENMLVEDEDITLNFSVQHRKTLLVHHTRETSPVQEPCISAQGDTVLVKEPHSELSAVKDTNTLVLQPPSLEMECITTVFQDKGYPLTLSESNYNNQAEEKSYSSNNAVIVIKDNLESEKLDSDSKLECQIVDITLERDNENLEVMHSLPTKDIHNQEATAKVEERHSEQKENEENLETESQFSTLTAFSENKGTSVSCSFQTKQKVSLSIDTNITMESSSVKFPIQESVATTDISPSVELISKPLTEVIYLTPVKSSDEKTSFASDIPTMDSLSPEITPTKSVTQLPALHTSAISSEEIMKEHAEEIEMETSESKPFEHTRSRTRSQSKSPGTSPVVLPLQHPSPKSPSRTKPTTREPDDNMKDEGNTDQIVKSNVNESESNIKQSDKTGESRQLSITSTKKSRQQTYSAKGEKEKLTPKKSGASKHLQFTFSKPSISEESEGLASLGSPQVPIPSFVFSPPLTRSRTKQKKGEDLSGSSFITPQRHSKASDVLFTDISPQMQPLDEKETSIAVTPIKSAKKKVKATKRSQKLTPIPPSQSVINLLTPIASGSEGSTKSQSHRSRASSSSRHGMVLRKSRLRGRKAVTLL